MRFQERGWQLRPTRTALWSLRMAERNLDPAMMQLLGRLRDDLAFIERKAKDAQRGAYEQELNDDPD